MLVSEYIEQAGRKVLTVKASDTIGKLARELQRHRVGVMIVSETGWKIDGIISERDIAYSLADRRGDLHLLPVSAIMARRVVTCTPGDNLPYVMELMSRHHIRHVPVEDEGRLTGMLSIRDVLEFRLDMLERRAGLARLLCLED